MARLRRFQRLCAQIAAEISSTSDAAIVHNSMYVAAPPVLGNLAVPSIYFCYEYPRHIYEPELIRRTGSPLLEALLAPLSAMEKKIDMRAALAADSIVCLSSYMAGRIREIYGRDASVVRPGMNLRFFCPLPSGGGGGGYVLSVGALWPFKGHDFVLKAAALAGVRSLVIVADREFPGYRRRLRRLAALLGVKTLILQGLSDVELRQVYRDASVVVCGQFREPYGLVPLEAAACGRPVVAVDDGGLPENLVAGETGFVVPRDPAAAAEHISKLVSDPAGASAMGIAGRTFVLARRRREDAAEALFQLVCRQLKIES
jgi:glycosyltransferase involved in cell wall biosynthesis